MPLRNPVTLFCAHCGKPFQVQPSKAKKRKHCSVPCNLETKKLFDPTEDELFAYVWETSTLQLGEHFGVSDKAIEKRCKKFNIHKPPRGYWALIYAGATRQQALTRLGWKKLDIDYLETQLAQVEL